VQLPLQDPNETFATAPLDDGTGAASAMLLTAHAAFLGQLGCQLLSPVELCFEAEY
jgi:hypothetical protein